MARSIAQLVDSYVGLGHVRALEDMMQPRARMLEHLRSLKSLKLPSSITEIEDEVRIIGEGLRKLKP